MRAITSSHQDYDEINHHMLMLNLIINSHMHNRYKSSIHYTPDMQEPEHEATVIVIKDAINDWLYGGVFKDYLNMEDIDNEQ